jgi:hypothetical protein
MDYDQFTVGSELQGDAVPLNAWLELDHREQWAAATVAAQPDLVESTKSTVALDTAKCLELVQVGPRPHPSICQHECISLRCPLGKHFKESRM